jgi:hypothetical protein
MQSDDVNIIGGPLVLSTGDEVDDAESRLGARFPEGYREFVTRFGEGVLGGTYIRIYPPRRILTGDNNVREWRERIGQYWFWDEGRDVLSRERALECVVFGDTIDGDEVAIHPSSPDTTFVFPRHSEAIYRIDGGLWPAIDWLCSSGELTQPFEERDFEPFDSRTA